MTGNIVNLRFQILTLELLWKTQPPKEKQKFTNQTLVPTTTTRHTTQ